MNPHLTINDFMIFLAERGYIVCRYGGPDQYNKPLDPSEVIRLREEFVNGQK